MMPEEANQNRESTIEKVRALLAKAEGSDYLAEAEAFQAKAQALITRHQIGEPELRLASSEIVAKEIEIVGWGNATRGVVHLYAGVSEINCCSAAHRVRRGTATVFIHGGQLDLEFTCVLVEHLLPQLRIDLLADKPRSRMSYALGWAHRVVGRLQTAKVAEAAALKALVPTNVRATEHLNTARRVRNESTRIVDGSEYTWGIQAGENVDIGQRKVAGPESSELG